MRRRNAFTAADAATEHFARAAANNAFTAADAVSEHSTRVRSRLTVARCASQKEPA